ncbi:hypothetical protein, partial [Methylobacterium sp. WL103]|uniref:hypothetical protein n=1 Tax=Methylobacterium sp. WL103 TaxID=2603891 RepID=UPI001AED63F1
MRRFDRSHGGDATLAPRYTLPSTLSRGPTHNPALCESASSGCRHPASMVASRQAAVPAGAWARKKAASAA